MDNHVAHTTQQTMDGIASNRCQERRLDGLRDARLLGVAEKTGARIDWTAVVTVLLMGELFDDVLPFAGMSPSFLRNKFTLPDGATTQCPLHDEEFVQGNAHRIKDVYGLYDDILRGAIKSLPVGMPTVMGLSGGRDSRHIALSIRTCGRALPRLVTSRHFLGGLSEADVVVARKLASRLGSEVRTVNQPGDRFRQEWDKNRQTGMQTLAHSWGLALADALNGGEVLIDGMNGGVLFGRSGLLRSVVRKFGKKKPPSAALREYILASLIDQPASSLRAWLPSHLMASGLLDSIRDRLAACFAQYEDFPNPVQAFQYGEHVYRNTRLFTYGIMQNEHVVCPLDAPEMVNFALGLPWSLSSDPDFQEKAISGLYQNVADIPYEEELGNLPAAWEPDQSGEAASWERIRKILSRFVSDSGLMILDRTRHRLDVIQRTTFLAQAVYWEEHGTLPDSLSFFGRLPWWISKWKRFYVPSLNKPRLDS